MHRPTLLGSIMVLVVALAATIRIEEGRLDHLRQRAATSALAASNAAAARDTTREVVLGDGRRVAERRVEQVTPRTYGTRWAPGIAHLARYVVRGTIDTLHASATADSAGLPRGEHFHVRQAPYTVDADVTGARADSARLALTVTLDTLSLEARVRCAAPDADGIREATIAVTGPAWAHVQLGRVEQDPALCRSPALASRPPGRAALRFAPLVLGVGRSLGPHGAGPWALFIGAGVRLGA